MKRDSTTGDFLEAAFHGEWWYRCHLCGQAYELHSAEYDKNTELHYCPKCHGYGNNGRKEDGTIWLN